jgi:hypothetical protein
MSHKIDSPSHAQMRRHNYSQSTPARTQLEEQVFATAGQAREFRTEQDSFQFRGRSRRESFGAAHLHIADSLVLNQRTQMSHEDFDFRQFRHGKKSPPR